jgi:hypothetical protein
MVHGKRFLNSGTFRRGKVPARHILRRSNACCSWSPVGPVHRVQGTGDCCSPLRASHATPASPPTGVPVRRSILLVGGNSIVGARQLVSVSAAHAAGLAPTTGGESLDVQATFGPADRPWRSAPLIVRLATENPLAMDRRVTARMFERPIDVEHVASLDVEDDVFEQDSLGPQLRVLRIVLSEVLHLATSY